MLEDIIGITFIVGWIGFVLYFVSNKREIDKLRDNVDKMRKV